MALYHWKKLGDELVKENPFWEYRLAEFELKDGKRIKYHYVHDEGGVTIVGVNNDGKIILLNQYRPLLGRESLEFPAGGVDPGRSLLETAKAEFSEEAQYGAHQIEQVGRFDESPGSNDHFSAVFVAHDLFDLPTEGDETEEFEPIWLTPQEIDDYIANGKITSGWSIAAWQLAKPKVMGVIDQLATKK